MMRNLSVLALMILSLAAGNPASAPAQSKPSSVEGLAESLASAKTDPERMQLLAAGDHLVSAQLLRAIEAQAARLSGRGDYSQARDLSQLALSLAERLKDAKGISTALRLIGATHVLQGEISRALPLLERSLKVAEDSADTQEIGLTLNNLGAVEFQQGRYAQSLGYFERSLKLAEASNDRPWMVRVLNNIGLIFKSQGDYSRSLEYLNRSLAIAEQSAGKVEVANILTNIGNIHHSQGDYQQAAERHLKSLRLAEEAGNKPVMIRAINNLGVITGAQGRYDEALEYYKKGLKIAGELGSKVEVASFLSNIGNAHSSRDNHRLALQAHEQSLKIFEEIKDNSRAAIALHNIGNVYKAQGNYEQALGFYNRSLALAERLGNKPQVTLSLYSVAATYHVQGDHREALAGYEKSLKLSESIGEKARMVYALSSIGNINRSRRNFAEADSYYQRSLKIAEELSDPSRVAQVMIEIAIASSLRGDHVKAIESAGRAASIARQVGRPNLLWQARTAAGKAHRALGQVEEARNAFAEAIEAVERMREHVAGGEQELQRFFEIKISPYHEMIDLMATRQDAAAALAYAERAKGRVLLDLIGGERAGADHLLTAEDRDTERRLNAEIISLNGRTYGERQRAQPDEARLAELAKRLQSVRLEYEAHQTSFYAAHPELRIKRGRVEPFTLAEAGDLLASRETVFLEYVVLDDSTLLFVIAGRAGKPELKVYRIEIGREALASEAERFRKSLAERNLGFREQARRMYDLLLKPAEADLRNSPTLCIVPDGALWEMPFQALQASGSGYLIEDHAIFYSPSLSILREMIRRQPTIGQPGDKALIAFGNPALEQGEGGRAGQPARSGGLAQLPETERELKALQRMYGPDSSRIYVGEQAQEARFKAEAGAFRVIHFATHAILDDRNPIYSHIVLSRPSDGSAEDGMLEARELLGMELSADIVVLSACETARGRIASGEGVMGMAWAVFAAGSPASVVSQWKVDSTSTSDLMIELHRNLISQEGKSAAIASKAEALRRAALKMIASDRYRHPFYWSGFVVIGNGF